MPHTVPQEISTLLAPGENVLWSAQPKPYVFMVRGLPNIAYGVTWSVLGAFWYHGAGGFGKFSVFQGWWRLTPLFSLPFILAGFSFFLYPIRLGALARRTWYVITDQRVFIAELHRRQMQQLRIFSSEELAAAQVRPRPGRLGDLLLSPSAQRNPHLTPRLGSGFFGLENATEAASLLPRINESIPEEIP